MTPSEAVLMDDLMQRGYTRAQAARALVALTLPEPGAPTHLALGWLWNANSKHGGEWAALEFQAEAERRGYLSREP